jgi:hypothetical protein
VFLPCWRRSNASATEGGSASATATATATESGAAASETAEDGASTTGRGAMKAMVMGALVVVGMMFL